LILKVLAITEVLKKQEKQTQITAAIAFILHILI